MHLNHREHSVNSAILVVGATGKTGRRLISALTVRGIPVRAASRTPPPRRPGVEPVAFDWSDPTTYAGALAGAGALYLVMPSYVLDPTTQLADLLVEAKAAGVGRIVLLSALGVDQAPADLPFRQVELLVEGSGIPSTILRPGAFMENFSEWHWAGSVRTIRERGEVVLPGGGTPVSYVSARDIALVAAVVLTQPGHGSEGYTLTGPAPLTLTEVAAYIATAAGRRVRHVESDLASVTEALLADGADPRYASVMTRMYEDTLLSGLMATVTSDVTAVTGRAPVSFAEFAADTANAWR